jgi:6-phosphogluconolactonase (cycloisomerase 2 family)
MIDIRRGAVFVQTNDATTNAVEAFARDAEGSLTHVGTFPTGGKGNGMPHLPSQGSVVTAAGGSRLLVANAGSGDVSLFEVRENGLELVGATPTGAVPTSIAVHGELVFVLATGGMEPGSIAGFRLTEAGLAAIEGASAPLSADEADGAQISFSPDGSTLVVTERVTDRISTYTVDADGAVEGPHVHASSGATPYGFDFAGDGTLVVTEAFGGAVGAAATSSYALRGAMGLEPVSASVPNSRSEVCWAAVTKDGRFAYVTNFGDGTISSYRVEADGSLVLADAVAAVTHEGEKGIRDEALTADGSLLYALDADAGEIFGWRVADDGSLAPVAATNGLPATVAGLATV